MLIWLGKNELGQTDKREVTTISSGVDQAVSKLIRALGTVAQFVTEETDIGEVVDLFIESEKLDRAEFLTAFHAHASELPDAIRARLDAQTIDGEIVK